jgi:hypothetical protein
MTIPVQEQRLKHGAALSEAVKAGQADAVPGNDKAHAHSHAAHLHDDGNTRLAPESIGKQGREPGAMIEAPQDPKRTSKTHARVI